MVLFEPMKRIIATIIVISAFAYIGWFSMMTPPSTKKSSDPDDITANIKTAYHTGLQAIMQRSYLRVHEIWYLKKIAQLDPAPTINNFLDEIHKDYRPIGSDRFFAPIAFPDAPTGSVDNLSKMGTSFDLLVATFYAANCRSYERYPYEIFPFVMIPAPSYMLNFQIMVLRWVEEQGCYIPDDWAEIRPDLHERLQNELSRRETFSDLLLAQTALSLMEGIMKKPPPETLKQIIAFQGENGFWSYKKGSEKSLSNLGLGNRASISKTLTTLQALFILAAEQFGVPSKMYPQKIISPQGFDEAGGLVTAPVELPPDAGVTPQELEIPPR
jgi:hypothetical protein